MVRASASRQCNPGSIPALYVVGGLSLCWFSILLRRFSSGSWLQMAVSCASRSYMGGIAAARCSRVVQICFRVVLFLSTSLLYYETTITISSYYLNKPVLQFTVCGESQMPVYPQRGNLLRVAKMAEEEPSTKDCVVSCQFCHDLLLNYTLSSIPTVESC